MESWENRWLNFFGYTQVVETEGITEFIYLKRSGKEVG
jgi:hypothetical protein